jgi:hypothetical protein
MIDLYPEIKKISGCPPFPLQLNRSSNSLLSSRKWTTRLGSGRYRKEIAGNLLVMGVIASGNSPGGKNNLPELIISGPKGTGTGEEVILPHAVKSLIIILF